MTGLPMHFSDLPKRSVKLQTLDSSGRTVSGATGFIVRESDGCFLYTCWHVVTGIDFNNPLTPRALPDRKALRVQMQSVARNEAFISVGGLRTFDIPLYKEDGTVAWIQEPTFRPQPDLEAKGLRVPQFLDLVIFQIQLTADEEYMLCFKEEDLEGNFSASVGEILTIGGFPYGYSVLGNDFPLPVFVSRTLAAMQTPNHAVQLLDGGGSQGMSGSPVYREQDNPFGSPSNRSAKLYGIYTGFLFPDYGAAVARQNKNDYFAALGTITVLDIARHRLWSARHPTSTAP